MTGTGGVDDIERVKAAFEHLLRDEFDIAHSTLEFEPHGRGARGGADAAGSHTAIVATE